jgi:hypothetical protein
MRRPSPSGVDGPPDCLVVVIIIARVDTRASKPAEVGQTRERDKARMPPAKMSHFFFSCRRIHSLLLWQLLRVAGHLSAQLLVSNVNDQASAPSRPLRLRRKLERSFGDNAEMFDFP